MLLHRKKLLFSFYKTHAVDSQWLSDLLWLQQMPMNFEKMQCQCSWDEHCHSKTQVLLNKQCFLHWWPIDQFVVLTFCYTSTFPHKFCTGEVDKAISSLRQCQNGANASNIWFYKNDCEFKMHHFLVLNSMGNYQNHFQEIVWILTGSSSHSFYIFVVLKKLASIFCKECAAQIGCSCSWVGGNCKCSQKLMHQTLLSTTPDGKSCKKNVFVSIMEWMHKTAVTEFHLFFSTCLALFAACCHCCPLRHKCHMSWTQIFEWAWDWTMMMDQ